MDVVFNLTVPSTVVFLFFSGLQMQVINGKAAQMEKNQSASLTAAVPCACVQKCFYLWFSFFFERKKNKETKKPHVGLE